jgi:glycylpeptide N-tetradecanoyltransferase
LAEKHDFWDTQPVVKFLAKQPEKDCAIDKNECTEKIQKEPFALPAGFEWVTLDITNDSDAEKIFKLLREHYVEDEEGLMRFDYPVELIRWVLQVPGYIQDWHVGVKATGKDGLLAFISGTPRKVQCNENVLRVSVVNFLCVHKKLRSKKLAPILIKEITRRCNLHNVW